MTGIYINSFMKHNIKLFIIIFLLWPTLLFSTVLCNPSMRVYHNANVYLYHCACTAQVRLRLPFKFFLNYRYTRDMKHVPLAGRVTRIFYSIFIVLFNNAATKGATPHKPIFGHMLPRFPSILPCSLPPSVRAYLFPSLFHLSII